MPEHIISTCSTQTQRHFLFSILFSSGAVHKDACICGTYVHPSNLCKTGAINQLCWECWIIDAGLILRRSWHIASSQTFQLIWTTFAYRMLWYQVLFGDHVILNLCKTDMMSQLCGMLDHWSGFSITAAVTFCWFTDSSTHISDICILNALISSFNLWHLCYSPIFANQSTVLGRRKSEYWIIDAVLTLRQSRHFAGSESLQLLGATLASRMSWEHVFICGTRAILQSLQNRRGESTVLGETYRAPSPIVLEVLRCMDLDDQNGHTIKDEVLRLGAPTWIEAKKHETENAEVECILMSHSIMWGGGGGYFSWRHARPP